MEADCLFFHRNDQTIVNFQNLTLATGSHEVLIILNNTLNLVWLQTLVKSTRAIILADGGANQLYATKFRDSEIIKGVVGDLDSIREEVKEYYREKGVPMIKMDDQDFCDFEKAIIFAKELGFNKIICMGALGGRMDHTIHHMSLASNFSCQNPKNEIIIMGKNSLMYFMKPDIQYVITVSNQIQSGGCGLMTFSKVDYVETKGFKWNMGSDQPFSALEWGKFQSTSNKIEKDTIQIKSSNTCFFVCELAQ